MPPPRLELGAFHLAGGRSFRLSYGGIRRWRPESNRHDEFCKNPRLAFRTTPPHNKTGAHQMKTYAARKDANDAKLARLARQLGAFWLSMEPGQGFDALIFHRGRVFIAEIKDGDKPPSRQQLTETEKKCLSICKAHGVNYNILRNEDDLLTLLS